MPIFECRSDLQTSPEELFDFLIHPLNLQRIAPPEVQFVFVNPPETIHLHCRLTCKAQAYGMVQQLTYEIVEFTPTTGFREKMVEGPLKRWVHDYIIESNPSEGFVTLVNRIDFDPPGGLLGFLVTADKILDTLEDGFGHRREELQKQFGIPKQGSH